jgi:predicted transposase YbfD/YdcC
MIFMEVNGMRDIFQGYISIIEDPRCQCDVKHRMTDVLILVMCGVLCGMDDLSDIVDFGEAKRDFLRERFGVETIPSRSTLTRVMNLVDAEKLSLCIVKMMCEMLGTDGEVIAIDGKTIRSTQTPCKEKLHIVTAYATENGVSLGQLAVGGKTNEIPVVRELIEMIDIKGKTLTMDAMHCQKDTAAAVVSGGGDYAIGLKDNQKLLHEDVALYIGDCVKDRKIHVETASTSEKSRDRFEERICFKAPDISWIEGLDAWPGLKSVYAVNRKTVASGKKSAETSYYLSSLDASCEDMLRIVREHWKIESMHWMLDVVFAEDDCRILSANGQKAMNIFRKLALALHKNYVAALPQKTKPSIRKNMLRSMLNEAVFLGVLGVAA